MVLRYASLAVVRALLRECFWIPLLEADAVLEPAVWITLVSVLLLCFLLELERCTDRLLLTEDTDAFDGFS